jgi:tRNA 2-thiouridine synthesizing protein E
MNDSNPQPDLGAVSRQLDAISAQLASLVAQQQKQQELLDELVLPLAKEVMKDLTGRLDGLEKKGYFAFARELLLVGEQVVEGYTPEDVRLLGKAMKGILDTVRAVTQPAVLAVAGEAAQVLEHADTASPVGLVGMVRATRDDEVQRGMAVMLELLKKVGRGAAALSAHQTRTATQKDKLSSLLGPRKKALGTERAAVPAVAPVVPAAARAALPPPAGCAVPSGKKAVTATVIDGIEFSADGHMVDPTKWTEALAVTLAAAQGVTLTDAHWALVRFARSDWSSTQASPNVRRITQGTGVTTKDIYALFPKAPGRTIARVAGIPKPAGCL